MKKCSTLILIALINIYAQADQSNTVLTEKSRSQQIQDKADVLKKKPTITPAKKDTYPGVEWKPKTEIKKDRDKYPGVEWKPKEGDPVPNQNENAYPGVEWTPKK